MPFLIRTACLLTLLFSATLQAKDDDDDDRPLPPTTSSTTSAEPHRQPRQTSLQQADIQTQPLKASEHRLEYTALGSVLNLEPLLVMRQHYLAALAQQDSAAARYQEADANLNRTRHLHQQDIVSTRRLQEQQALWRNDQANLATTHYQQQALLAASRLQWGDTLTAWFTQPQHKQAEHLLNQKAQLLQITLPANRHLSPDIRTIAINAQGRRDQAATATLIAQSPQVDSVTQGERYFFQCENLHLPFGAHITAWIPHGSEGESGVLIPGSAVVWHLGQAFVFIKTAEPDHYSRRLLPAALPSPGGYFSATGFSAGEEIVTVGAQTLLSDELKNQIPSEDND